MNKRRGYSLIEMLVTISVSGTVLGIAVVMINTLMQLQRDGRRQLQYHTTLGRLERQFRRDVHAARGLQPLETEPQANPPAAWQFEFAPYRAVRYSIEQDGLIRSEQGGSEQGGTARRRREVFRLGADRAVSIRMETEAAPATVSLLITRGTAGPAASRSKLVRIEAVLGRDQRFEKHEKRQEPRT